MKKGGKEVREGLVFGISEGAGLTNYLQCSKEEKKWFSSPFPSTLQRLIIYRYKRAKYKSLNR